jgi:glycosyltransferase involved in cell wall biosynthesis
MTPTPRVTVVIPHHNGGPFLADALRSVEEQRWRDWEIVIVDDGSADEHRRAIHGFASDRIRVLEQANQGPAAATQAGIDVARGEYIAFLDQDDLWHPHKLERDVRLLDMHPTVDITFCGYQMIDECGRALAPPHVPRAERFDASDLLEDFCIGPTATVTVRSAAARQAGPIDTSLRRFYDFEYFVRIASRRPASVAASRESLAWYRRHPGQLSANVSQMRLEWQDAFGAMVSRYDIDDRAVRIAQSNMHRYFAFLEYEQGRFGAASRRMVEAFCFAPARFVTERRNWRAASGALTALILPASVRQRRGDPERGVTPSVTD